MSTMTAYEVGGGLASYSFANTKTQVRRLQRKHSQFSYRHMKAKLLSLISPLPAVAIKAADLEAFRESIYLAKKV